MISSSKRDGASPASRSAARMAMAAPGARICNGDRFTASVTSSGQVAAIRAALAVIQLPSVMIAPVSSARGMNSSGNSSPLSGWNQRTKASNARMRPVARSTMG